MTSQRKQRRRVYCLMRERGGDGRLEDRQWDSMPAVGREFGSPDSDRLMEEDYRQGRGVFDPALAAAVGKRRMGFLKGRLVVPGLSEFVCSRLHIELADSDEPTPHITRQAE